MDINESAGENVDRIQPNEKESNSGFF